MNAIDVVQQSPEWFAVRAGIVTASCADEILTPKAMKPAAGREYFKHLLAERLLGEPIEAGGSAWTDRGAELEPRARAWFANEYDVDTEEVGFLVNDAGDLGASPDALVGTDSGLEIKIPGAKAHVGHMEDPEGFYAEHRGQVQVNLLVTGRPRWTLVSWNPRLPAVVVPCVRDEAYLAAFSDALKAFNARLAAAVEKWQGKVKPRRRSAAVRVADHPIEY